ASYVALGKYAAAEPHLQRALALREQHPDAALPLASALGSMANLYDVRGEFVRADSFYHRALAALPSNSRDSAVAHRSADLANQLARMQSQQGHYPEAVALLLQVLARQRQLDGPISAAVARTTGDLGVTLLQAGQVVRADSAFEAAITVARQLNPPDRLLEGTDLGRLATALDLQGKIARSDSAYRMSLAILDSIQGPDHPDVTWIRYNYAGSLADWGQPRRALDEADQVLALRGRTLPETHPMLPGVLIVKGQALASLGDHVGAAGAMQEALTLRQQYLVPGHWLIGSAQALLGAELWDGGRTSEGLQLMTAGCRLLAKDLGREHPKTRDALSRLRKAGHPDACS
ncbi:MAG: tetratricopeptide repeat protein, partial [Gemmatimonadales bacterium]